MDPGDARVREHAEEGIEVRLVGPAVAVRVNRRPQWWRSYSALAAALALVALVAVVLTSPGGSPSLAVKETQSAPAILSAGPPSTKVAVDTSLPLRQMLKIHNPRSFTVLQSTQVTRAKACPAGRKCHFMTHVDVATHTDLVEYDKKPDSATLSSDQEAVSKKSADEEMGVTMEFDVAETDFIGCTQGVTAYELEITKVHQDKIAEKQEGETHEVPPMSDTEEAAWLAEFQAYPFVFVQAHDTGLFVDYVMHRDEPLWVADIKRSLVKDLNPIIAVKPEYRASVQHGATQLFQMYEADMNGHHHAVFKISKVNSKTKTEHVRQLLAQGEDGLTPREKEKKLVEKQLQSAAGIDYEDEGDGADEGKTTYEQEDRSGGAPHMQGEPDNCPYPLPSVEGNDSGKSHKTSTSNGDELEEYDEDASLGMGQEHAPADKVKASSSHEEDEEDATGIKPVELKASAKVDLVVKRTAVSFQNPVCAAQYHGGTIDEMLVQRNQHEHFVKRPFAELFSKKGLEEHLSEATVEKRVQRLVALSETHSTKVAKDKKKGATTRNVHLMNPGEHRRFVDGCANDQIREATLKLLTGPDTRRRRDLAMAFFSGCSGAVDSNPDVQTDLVAVATNSTANAFARTRGLYAIMASRCPLSSTIDNVKALSDAEDRQSHVKETATLVLGALLRKHRQCSSSLNAQARVKAEHDLNHELHQALQAGDKGRAQVMLYAMENSASGHHLAAIQSALKTHGAELQTLALKPAVKAALTKIGVEDSTHDTTLRAQLLQRLENPAPEASPFMELAAVVDKCPAESQSVNPALCYGLSLPSNGDIQTLINFEVGTGAGPENKGDPCTAFAFGDAAVVVSAKFGGPFKNVPGLNPLTVDVIGLAGQAKFASDPVGGVVSIFGFTVKTWGSGIIEPGACEEEFDPFEAVQEFVGESPFYSPPKSYIGYCGFNEDGFEGIEPLEIDRVFPVPGVDSIGYKIGPVGISLYADYGFRSAFNLGAMDAWLDETNLKKAEKWVDKNWRQGKPLFKDDPEVPDLQIFQDWKVGSPQFDAKEEQCLGGGGAARVKFEAALFVEGGVQATAGMARARLGVEVILLNAEARASAELLKTGVGREVYMGISSLSGSILAYLEVLMLNCECRNRVCKWGKCWCALMKCEKEWEEKFRTTLWGWSSPGFADTGNLACRMTGGGNKDLCRDKDRQCCGNVNWATKPKCKPGYVPRMDHPANMQQCTNPACYEYGATKGMACFGCWPKPGVGANFGCPVIEEWGPIGKAASAVWKMVQVIKFGMDNIADFLDGHEDPNGNGIICYAGHSTCADEDEEKARGLAKLDAPKKSMLLIKPQMAASGEQSNLGCDYLDPFGEGYRGTANVAASGKPCLPWPQEWVVLHHGGGLAKDPSGCAGIPADTRCWDACLAQLETNNFCRNPNDSTGPFCRIGGDDKNPVFEPCDLKQCPLH